MKRIQVILCVLAFHSVSNGQIIMQTNLPTAIPLNTEMTFDVKIKKGNLANFSKYQLEVPQGVKVQEVDSRLGSFSVEENTAKIIWVITPLEPEYTITLKLISGTEAGSKTFVQKYFYMENDDKKEVEMEGLTVVFKDSTGASPTTTSTAEFRTLISKTQLPHLTTKIDKAEISTKNPEVLKQQVVQLRKDSKDALEVGEREKAKAQLKLNEANEALSKAETITGESDKKVAVAKATDDKQKAENDLEVASRVLTLAKSLEDNANEIESINKSLHPSAYTETGMAGSSGSASNSSGEGSFTTVDLNNLDEPSATAKTKEGKKVSHAKDTKIEEVVKESGLVFKIQLGAFSNEPKKSDFKALGKISVTTENGMYKVLYGSYATKEEAFKKREEVISKGFDGFVVSYQDGVRVK